MSYYAAFLDLRGRRCAVLGGSELAVEKAQGLLEAGASVTIFAPQPCQILLDLRRAFPGPVLVRRDYRTGDLAGMWLAIDASEDERTHAAAQAEAEREHVLLNVVDRPERCGFIAPALVRRGPLQIAISTSGESPFLASAVRSTIERLIGPEWGPFLTLMGQLRRELRQHRVSRPAQLAIYRRLLASDVRQRLRAGDLDGANREAAAIASETWIDGLAA